MKRSGQRVDVQKSWWVLLAHQYTGPFSYVLLGIALFYGAMGDYRESIVVIVLYGINGLLAFWQEYRSYYAIQLLEQHIGLMSDEQSQETNVSLVHTSAFARETPRIVRFITSLLVVSLVLIMIGTSLIRGISFNNMLQMFVVTVALVISVIPEALPFVITSALAQGAIRLVNHGIGVVTQLSVVEDLGRVRVLCCDTTLVHEEQGKTTTNVLAEARKFNIVVKIVSSESAELCEQFARSVGFSNDHIWTITGQEWEALGCYEQQDALKKYHVFASCTDQHKAAIIHCFQQSGNLVGYVSNDTSNPLSLREAHVAMVGKRSLGPRSEAVDIIVTNSTIPTVLQGVAVGRAMLHNIMTYLHITLATSVSNLYSIAGIALFFDIPDVFPLHMLIVNILSDLPFFAIATDNVDNESLENPEHFNRKHMLRNMLLVAGLNSFMDGMFLVVFYKSTVHMLETLWVMWSIISELAIIFSLRTRKFAFFGSMPSWQLTILSCAAAGIAMVLPFTSFGVHSLGYTTPHLFDVAKIMALVVMYFGLSELLKLYMFRKQRTVHVAY